MARLAVKVAYDGTRFSGSQIQPHVRTVHSELAAALAAMGEPDARILWAGRTDAGVSAAANVAVFETGQAPASLLPGVTFRMEGAWAWAWAEVDERFEPRHAKRRRYRYHLRANLDAADLHRAMKPFVGTHDFTAFCRIEADVNPVRTVSRVDVRREGAHLLVDIEGESFLWNQVRRMVEAGRRVAVGELPKDAITDALKRAELADLGTAPPEPLVLMDVVYNGVDFQTHPDLSRIMHRLDDRIHAAETRLTTLRGVREATR